ncbi:MAG: DegV family protein [Clostridia bacterium]|nr:DegV family protein [Clostridia bacterium]
MVKICSDSCCDLTAEQLKENNIAMIPLFVTLGEDDYLDGVSIQPEDIYDYVKKTKQLPKTAARSTEDFKEFFEELLADGSEVVYTGIGSQLSSTFDNARRAKEEMGNDRLFVVDSKSLSTGIGLLVLYAAGLAKEGKSGSEIAKAMEEQSDFNQASFVVDKLDYLHKGGRCSGLARFGANLLKIKPRLELVEGKIENTGKYMGQFKVVLKKYVDDMLAKCPNPKKDICFVTHTKTDADIVESVIEYVKSKNIFDCVVETTAGATITCHCGENTLGVLFLLERE